MQKTTLEGLAEKFAQGNQLSFVIKLGSFVSLPVLSPTLTVKIYWSSQISGYQINDAKTETYRYKNKSTIDMLNLYNKGENDVNLHNMQIMLYNADLQNM